MLNNYDLGSLRYLFFETVEIFFFYFSQYFEIRQLWHIYLYRQSPSILTLNSMLVKSSFFI